MIKTTGIVIGDIHCPYQDQKLIDLYKKVIEKLKPNEFILLGDTLNYSAYNRHGKRKNEIPYEQISKDHDEAEKVLDTFQNFKIKNRIWIDGNHEINQDDYFTENPDTYDESSHRYNRLKLKDRNYKIFPFTKPYKNGKLYFTHGWRAGENAVKYHLVKDFKKNFVMGHIHRSDTATTANIEAKIYQGYAIGCSCQRQFRYTPNQSTNHGFGIYYILKNGNFQFFNIPVINYQFIFEGKIFK